jgi:hypothetical protein
MKFPLSIRLFLVVLVALNISFIFLAASESLEQSQTNTNRSEFNSYLFIEILIQENISGRDPPLCINFSTCDFGSLNIRFGPSYTLNESKLISIYYTEISPAPIGVIMREGINYSNLEHNSSRGLHTLHQIVEFPYSSHDFNITDLDDDVIAANYHGQHFTLKPGDLWSNKNEKILTPEYGKNATIIRDVMIKNHGRLELVVEGSPQCSGIWC